MKENQPTQGGGARRVKEGHAIKSTKEDANEKKMKAKNTMEKRNLRRCKKRKERQGKKNEHEEHHKAAEFEKKQMSRPIITGKVKSSVFISEDNTVQTYAAWRYRSTQSQCLH